MSVSKDVAIVKWLRAAIMNVNVQNWQRHMFVGRPGGRPYGNTSAPEQTTVGAALVAAHAHPIPTHQVPAHAHPIPTHQVPAPALAARLLYRFRQAFQPRHHNDDPSWSAGARLLYRFWQAFQHLGVVAPLTEAEYAEVARRLPAGAFQLFQTMSPADQRHSLRVCQGLLARGYTEADLLAAALLHDVGKAGGRVPFWTRPAIVLGKLCLPRLLAHLALPPVLLGERIAPRWQRALSYAWWHAEIGAELAGAAGLSTRAVLYIRTHHQPHGPAAALHAVDEVS